MNQSAWENMNQVYEARAYDSDATYADTDPAYLQSVRSVERLTLAALRRAGVARRLGELEILDYGCGNAKWMGRWLAWGANLEKLHGVVFRPSPIFYGLQSFSNLDLRVSIERLLYPDGFFEVVSQNLVFANMLEYDARKAAADELLRVLALGGLLLLYDLRMNNPNNPNVRRCSWQSLGSW